ncbi:PIN domain-containing protein [Tsuneonella rigui]|jgi:predicted nucleic acid-binding protein|uniref:PIN domain-containing protein n=1 Tax=Tsuneonella rigui TaxID=1708790 RepID=UPI000F7E8179|nr:PIN domain-containing protein [Tsuneonella rigui]
MSGFAFDANIVIDALSGFLPARAEIQRAVSGGGRAWISRMAWLEVLSKGDAVIVKGALAFMSHFGIDEMDEEIALRAAALRRERPRLKSPDAVILASAQTRGRVLVTRNTKDFPAEMPGVRVPYIL